MINSHDILETIDMIDNENLDVRTITMGISLFDCIDPDASAACDKIYDKICRYAGDLVKTGEDISKEYGIPIIHKRISVTPISMIAAACPGKNPVCFAKAPDRAAKATGVNFIGGYSALVHKGFGPGDYAVIESIPEALSRTELVCSSVNIGTTKAGINMDAVEKMGHIVCNTAKATATANVSARQSWLFSAMRPKTTRLWPVLFTAPASRTVKSTSVSPAPVWCARPLRKRATATSRKSPTSSKRRRSR